MAEVAIVNASPWILLSKAGHLQLLERAASAVVMPASVAAEIRAHRGDVAVSALEQCGWLRTIEDAALPASVAAWDLGPGESAVLAAALASPGAVAVLDELAGRRCAAALGIAVRGCVGLALAARSAGELPLARPVMEDLRRAGLWQSDAVLSQALALVGE